MYGVTLSRAELADPLKLGALRVVVFGFGAFDAHSPSITTTTRTPLDAWPNWIRHLSVPVYDFGLPATVREAIEQVEMLKSLLAPGRDAEGVVWTHVDGVSLAGLGDRPVWKSISARYLTT